MTRDLSKPANAIITRRQALVLAAGAAATAAIGTSWLSSPAFAQRRTKAAEVPVTELMKPGPLPEMSMGDEKAPITMVEYASMTCGHCAAFHNKVLPKIKEKYIETGKVRLVMREFPLDNLAAIASMAARCAGEGKSLPLISAMFAKQDDWAFVRPDPRPALFNIVKQAGFTQESYDKCITDQKLLDDIVAIRERGADVFGVDATPSFFINAKRFTGSPVFEEFEKTFEGILTKS
ncbi:MAG: DsbA family protein [Hyphomicrobiales bacterium]|nr:MAG: DsbA family protein [Hyphomicrobiales bacterium]